MEDDVEEAWRKSGRDVEEEWKDGGGKSGRIGGRKK